MTQATHQQTLRWGIISTGNIAHSLAQDIALCAGSTVQAVTSRSMAKAQEFANQYAIPEYYDDIRSMLTSETVNVIYVATPHPQHYDITMAALHHHKHVLCEKPITLNYPQAKACYALAKQQNRFLMEAVWMRCFPIWQQVKTWLAEDKIGSVQCLQANFCIDIPFDPSHRLYAPELGGGALLDLGIYPLSLANMLFGMPDKVVGHCVKGTTGVDEVINIHGEYATGLKINLSASMRFEAPITATILGSRGRIHIPDNFLCPWKAQLEVHKEAPDTIEKPFKSRGYTYEIEEVERCITSGKIESSLVPWADSLAMMKLMDSLRDEWGIQYPSERHLIEATTHR